MSGHHRNRESNLGANGECYHTRLYNHEPGQTPSADNYFEEVLLWDPDKNNTVFTSLLEEADTWGFTNNTYDFEMIVLENGHGTDTSTTTYYFYVELQ